LPGRGSADGKRLQEVRFRSYFLIGHPEIGKRNGKVNTWWDRWNKKVSETEVMGNLRSGKAHGEAKGGGAVAIKTKGRTFNVHMKKKRERGGVLEMHLGSFDRKTLGKKKGKK